MNNKIAACIAAVLLALAGTSSASATETTAYEEISHHYEAIRLALLLQSTAVVAEHAARIQRAADDLAKDFDSARAGVAAEQVEETKGLLVEIGVASQMIADAPGLDEIRDAFFDLSKPLGRYRKLVGDLESRVAFCPMVNKAWIQPQGEIGNPYLGTEMPSCGRIIAD